jgi:transcriptional regulator with XRE-family HTH domain
MPQKPNIPPRPNPKLRNARKRKGLTIEQLAIEMDVSPLTVWRWERQEQVPRLETLRQLKEFFGMTEEALGFGFLFEAEEGEKDQNDR